ncbi:hypothetical protein DRP53_04550 [candidate division WOR-3 bacterium]|uniref:LTD domain-containing protein n=1 Tax=candidate division WOR-3 bacterium TaxID=2052148 RepID=A0A660SIF6_UNCW3|nr:MAG: hypothetical protein DRP53_04550 [candidate division WOR-3 bacterium]
MIVLIFLVPIITEVMANVKGPESGPGDRNEFVEIYNNSSDTIDLAGWYFSDLDAVDELVAWDDSTILKKYPNLIINSTLLPPHSYALILDREYTRPDTDQYQQPYAIPDSTLILTTDDTSLGNGLSTKDPILIFRPLPGETTTFGTPFDTLDTIPFDPGDGISLEIINLDQGDTESNWWPSLDPSGSTPGWDNSTFKNFDLAIGDLILHPPIGSKGSAIILEAAIHNAGLQPAQGWSIKVYEDQNRDRRLTETELIKTISGSYLHPGSEEVVKTRIGHFEIGEHWIGVRTLLDGDVNPANDTGFILLRIVPETGRLILSPKLFYPEKTRLQIEYQLPAPGGHLKLSIYTAEGRKVEDLIDQKIDQSSGTIFWDGQGARIGYYIIRFDYEVDGVHYQERKTFVVAR